MSESLQTAFSTEKINARGLGVAGSRRAPCSPHPTCRVVWALLPRHCWCPLPLLDCTHTCKSDEGFRGEHKHPTASCCVLAGAAGRGRAVGQVRALHAGAPSPTPRPCVFSLRVFSASAPSCLPLRPSFAHPPPPLLWRALAAQLPTVRGAPRLSWLRGGVRCRRSGGRRGQRCAGSTGWRPLRIRGRRHHRHRRRRRLPPPTHCTHTAHRKLPPASRPAFTPPLSSHEPGWCPLPPARPKQRCADATL